MSVAKSDNPTAHNQDDKESEMQNPNTLNEHYAQPGLTFVEGAGGLVFADPEIRQALLAELVERELLLVKVKAKATQVGRLWSATQKAGGRVLWDAADSFTIELTSNEAEINRFIAEISAFGEVLEVVRSGALAIQKGKEVLES